MDQFIRTLRADYPHVVFIASDGPSWSPRTQQITYPVSNTPVDIWSTLHELGHALLRHTNYESDLDLLQKEVAAWEKAIALADQYHISIDPAHIQSCLDTYRDWLHRRSTCPECEAHGLQPTQGLYSCFNCRTIWSVSRERFCRPYRLKRQPESIPKGA